jgi:hypothetical protein
MNARRVDDPSSAVVGALEWERTTEATLPRPQEFAFCSRVMHICNPSRGWPKRWVCFPLLMIIANCHTTRKTLHFPHYRSKEHFSWLGHGQATGGIAKPGWACARARGGGGGQRSKKGGGSQRLRLLEPNDHLRPISRHNFVHTQTLRRHALRLTTWLPPPNTPPTRPAAGPAAPARTYTRRLTRQPTTKTITAISCSLRRL